MSSNKIPALDALQATLLISKHLTALLPFLLALRNVPVATLERVGLIQSLAREIAGEGEFARDWYTALELLTGEDLSTRSVADLLELSVEQLSNGRLGEVWQVAYKIGLLDEALMGQWLLWEGLTGRLESRDDSGHREGGGDAVSD